MINYARITSFPCWYGKYELMKRLGAGGMAEVFLARLPGPEAFERVVVIKRILPELAHDQRMTDSLVAEATLAAQVQHKNIVQVFELQQLESGELFMSMEYIEGTDLAALIRAANKNNLRIPPWFSLNCAAEVLEGLVYAHELKDKHGRPRNLVHRDVTPSNIFISKLGAVKLADFGVAKDETRDSKTLRGELKGKLAYMSPEQLLRQQLDRRADIFAIGVVLWELLAQRRLFGGARRPEIDTMNLICSAPRTAPSAYRRDVHRDLDRCVLRALQIDPEARYQDARGFHKQLLDILDQQYSASPHKDMCEIVEIITGTKPAPPSLTLNVGAPSSDPADYAQTESFENSTELVASRPDLPAPELVEPSRGMSRSYRGEFPFWLREDMQTSGPHNFWDVHDRLKHSAAKNSEISVDGQSWFSTAEYARLTGQEGLFPTRKPGVSGEFQRIHLSLLAALANLAASHAHGVLEIDFPTGSGDVHLTAGAISGVTSTHLPLQTPEILVRESILTTAQLPALVHQALCDRRPIQDAALSDGWHDADELRRRIFRLRLAALLAESTQMKFRRHDAVNPPPPTTPTLALLPMIAREAFPARALKTMLGEHMRSRLMSTRRLVDVVDGMKLGREELTALDHLLDAETLKKWIERNPDYESSYLHLPYVLLEIGLFDELPPIPFT